MESARFLLWTALVLYPAFWLLDLMVIPEETFSFLSIRIAVMCVYLWAITAAYSRGAERLARPFMLASAAGSAAGLFLMAAFLDGSFNGYFADGVVILLVMGLFLPWDVGSAAALGALALLIHLGINLAVHGPSPEIARPLAVLAGSGAFIVLAAVFRRRTRRRALSEVPLARCFTSGGLPRTALETVSAGGSLEVLAPSTAHDSAATP